MSYLVEIIILAAILLVGGILRKITLRRVKGLEGSLGLVKKRQAKKGKIIGKN